MHSFLPFATAWQNEPDFDSNDARDEDARLIERNEMLAQAWRGERPLDEALDCLQDQGVGADAYLDMVIDNINYVISQRLQLTETDFLIPSSDIVVAKES